MSENIDQLIKYLNSEDLKIDRSEFIFQFESHPDSPSLLAISDTLSFFKIKNGAFKVGADDISNLPMRFMASLKTESETSIFFIERKGDRYLYQEKSGKIKYNRSQNELKGLWEGVVLLADGSEMPLVQTLTKNKFLRTSLMLTLIVFLGLIVFNDINYKLKLFYLLPLVGILFSLAVFKDILFKRSGLIDKFCGMTPTSSCESVINSAKWKIFEYVKFSDLSLVFFISQFVGYFVFNQLAIQQEFFIIQKILLIACVPIIFTSLYFQGVVEKKWCPICLSISSILIIEGFLTYFMFNYPVSNILYSVAIYCLIFLSISTLWMHFKKTLQDINKLKEIHIKSNKFKRTYSVFKNSLISDAKYNIPESRIILGNPGAKVSLTFITSPFCGFCKEPYYSFKDLLKNYNDDISVSIIYNVHENNQMLKLFAENIIQGYINYGEDYYFKAMDYWYEVNDLTKWLEKFEVKQKSVEIEHMLKKQRNWLTELNFNFTPILFLNGFKFPDAYEISDINFLLDEILFDLKEEKMDVKISSPAI